tara:strand:- start:507 stop:1448 length:942 start_codon:yes stop_codon:yes gene_type:complete
MKAFKVFVLVFLSVNILIWLVTYFLNINLFSILQIQTPNIEVREPSYKLTTNVSKSPIGNFDPVFILYDEDCNKYGPYKLSETVLEIQKGLSTTCSSLISDENEILINIHDRRDASLTNVKNDISNLLYSSSPGLSLFPGFEGDEEANLRIQLAIYQLPDPLRSILINEVQVLNGCHPYGEALFNRCVYGVFDPVGYGADGNFGNDWAMTIWISDRGLESGKLKDILTHEAAHAYSYLVLKQCVLQDGSTFRNLAHQRYGNEENLADVFVYYYGGKWTNYYKLDYLPVEENKWMTDMIEYCNIYEQALSSLSS